MMQAFKRLQGFWQGSSPIDLVLFGVSGHGRKTIGNSILGAKAFGTSTDIDAGAHLECSVEKKNIHGRTIVVWNTPGLETGLKEAESQNGILKAFNISFLKCEKGFHAIVLVLKVQSTTEEEVSAVWRFKALLGRFAFRDFGLVVFTHGDEFNSTLDFEEWCRNQEGKLGDILEECLYRCVLFNNVTEDDWTLRSQREKLLKVLEELQSRKRSYSKEDLESALKDRPVPPGPDLDLVMFGHTGHGRKSVGNNTLDIDHFTSSNDGQSQTSPVLGKNCLSGRTMTVYNTPGLSTGPDALPSQDSALDALEKSLSSCEEGFHAILLVLNVALRNASQLTSLHRFTKLLGENALRDFGVLVFTHGDQFASVAGGMTFDQWVQRQTSPLADIIQACQNRCVLFNNVTQDTGTLKRQRLELIKRVDRLVVRSAGRRYTVVDFESASKDWPLPPGPDLQLLLIGKTGNGKSATGNSLLGRAFFPTSCNSTSETTTSSLARNCFGGRGLTICDTPGVCDTKYESKESYDRTFDALDLSLKMCSKGFHALLIVLKFPLRMTKEEHDAVKQLETMLGGNMLRNHGVLIFTGGDSFAFQAKGRSFQQWCRDQTEALKTIIQECQYRCVIFNNVTEDLVTLHRQRCNLMKLVKSQPYTSEYFKAAQEMQRRAEAEGRTPDVAKEMLLRLNLIHAEITHHAKRGTMTERISSDLKKEHRQLLKLIPKLERKEQRKMSDQLRLIEQSLEEMDKVMIQASKPKQRSWFSRALTVVKVATGIALPILLTPFSGPAIALGVGSGVTAAVDGVQTIVDW